MPKYDRRDDRPHLHYDGNPVYVPPTGDVPCDVMVVGERPGEDEAIAGVPFVGKSGAEQDAVMRKNGMHRHSVYLTNLVKTWVGGANPTQEEINEFEGTLIAEIGKVRPKFILAVGAHSARWFLGDCDMEAVHGLPQRSSRPGLKGIVVIPTYHPAYGLRDPDAKALVHYDYQQAGKIIRGAISREPIQDSHPTPEYIDGGLHEMLTVLSFNPKLVAEDTEGLRGTEWGFSISTSPGTGYVFRRRHPEFEKVAALYKRTRESRKFTSILHNSMWDCEIERGLGLGNPAAIIDTMVMAFFLRLEPQALKTLARRHCGMTMRSYEETIGEAAQAKHLDYLFRAGELSWSQTKNEPQLIHENDGTFRIYTPQPLHRTVNNIFTDFAEDKRDKEGNPVDLEARWWGIDKSLRLRVEQDLGPWPLATLDDIPLEDAIWYAGRDPDATIRVQRSLKPMITDMMLDSRLQLDLDIIPIFEEMQSTGIPASRVYFEALRDKMWGIMDSIGHKLSQHYNGGKPFNPLSQPQVSALAERLHLVGAKRTKTGKVSTSKKSMEHLRGKHEAMGWVFEWREHEKVKDSFCEPILERIDAIRRLSEEKGVRLEDETKSNEGDAQHGSGVEGQSAVPRLRGEIPLLRAGLRPPGAEDEAGTHSDDVVPGVEQDGFGGDSEVRPSVRELPPVPGALPDVYPIRCNIKITRVAQDRISASDPNLTAMPVASELGRSVRDGFRIPDDVPEVFLTGDMSQIEMRVMADLSRDRVMCEFFEEGRDIHSETCIKIFGLPVVGEKHGDEYKYPGLSKDLRNPTKRAGFGVITGIAGEGLYDQLRMMKVDIEKFCRTMGCDDPVAACNKLIADWFVVYPGCKGFLKKCGDMAQTHGMVREQGGFIRYLPGAQSTDKWVCLEARRQSHSHIISGTAQTMLRTAMLWLKPQIESLRQGTGLPIHWLMQIHDEVLFRVHEDIAPVVKEMLHEALTKHAGSLRVPIGASTAIAKTWGSLEK